MGEQGLFSDFSILWLCVPLRELPEKIAYMYECMFWNACNSYAEICRDLAVVLHRGVVCCTMGFNFSLGIIVILQFSSWNWSFSNQWSHPIKYHAVVHSSIQQTFWMNILMVRVLCQKLKCAFPALSLILSASFIVCIWDVSCLCCWWFNFRFQIEVRKLLILYHKRKLFWDLIRFFLLSPLVSFRPWWAEVL